MTNTHTTTHELALSSLGQQRIWSMCQSFPHVPLYNIAFSIYLEGDFDIELAEKTFNIIINRHQALRTTFTCIDSQLKQIIAPEPQAKLTVIYRENLPLDEIPHEIKRIAHNETRKYFDLHDGPLIRTLFIKFANNRYGWVTVMHHAISDGWSMGLYAYETNIIYRALATEQPIKLPNVTMQHADYVNLQSNKITSAAFSAELNYWEKRLSGMQGSTELAQPKDLAFKRLYHPMSRDTVMQAKELSKRYKTTLFTIFLIAFRLVLKEYQGAITDPIITVPSANRNHHSLHQTIGYLVNLVPIRMKATNDLSLEEVITHAIHDLREDFAHGTIPIEYLSQHLQLSHSHFDNPFYQTLFSFQNYPVPANTYQYNIIDFSDYFDITEFNLTFRMSMSTATTYKSQSEIEITYHPDMHQHEAMQQLMTRYCQMIEMMSQV